MTSICVPSSLCMIVERTCTFCGLQWLILTWPVRRFVTHNVLGSHLWKLLVKGHALKRYTGEVIGWTVCLYHLLSQQSDQQTVWCHQNLQRTIFSIEKRPLFFNPEILSGSVITDALAASTPSSLGAAIVVSMVTTSKPCLQLSVAPQWALIVSNHRGSVRNLKPGKTDFC